MTWWLMFVIVTWIWSCCVYLVLSPSIQLLLTISTQPLFEIWTEWISFTYKLKWYTERSITYSTMIVWGMPPSTGNPGDDYESPPASVALMRYLAVCRLSKQIFLHCCCWVFCCYIVIIVCCVWLCLGWAEVSTLILTGLRLPRLFISKFHNNWKSSIVILLLTNTEANRNHSVPGEFIFIQSWSSSLLYEATLCFLQLSDFSFRSRRPILIIIISRNSMLAKSLATGQYWQLNIKQKNKQYFQRLQKPSPEVSCER